MNPGQVSARKIVFYNAEAQQGMVLNDWIIAEEDAGLW